MLSHLSAAGTPSTVFLVTTPALKSLAGVHTLQGTLGSLLSVRSPEAGGTSLCTVLCRSRARVIGCSPGQRMMLVGVQALDEDVLLPGAGGTPPVEGLAGLAHLPSSFYQRHNAGRLGCLVQQQWVAAGLPALPEAACRSPSALAWWVLRSLPSLDEGQRWSLYASASCVGALLHRLAALLAAAAAAPTVQLTCSTCSAVLARDSIAALANPFGSSSSSSGSGTTASSHVFVNPAGISFRVFTLRALAEGSGCVVLGTPSLQHTWFENYAWQPVECACEAFLGWRYSAATADAPVQDFYGLREEAVAVAVV